MKYLLLATLSLLTIALHAQEFTFNDSTIEYEDEMIQSIHVTLTPEVSTIKDKFEDWMDDNYEVDLDGKKLLFFNKDVMSAEGVVIPKITSTKIDLHVKVDETQNGKTDLNVFASLGYNNWLSESEYPYEYMQLKEIVQEFITEYLPKYYLNDVDEKKEKLKDLNNKAEDLDQEMASNIVEIEKLKKENIELMKKMQSNQKQIRKSESQLKLSKSKFEKVNENVKSMNNYDQGRK